MGFTFDNSRLCIDFLATSYGPAEARIEMLYTSRSLADWIRAAGVADGARVLGVPELYRARGLRELIDRLLRAAQEAGRPPANRWGHVLNALARHDRPVLRLPGGDRIIRRGGFQEFLAELATDTLDLLSQPAELAGVGWCAAADCRRIFRDQSAGGRRRWCSKTGKERSSPARRRGFEALRRLGEGADQFSH